MRGMRVSRATGRPSLTWPESVDQALCYGWIDGVRRSLGAEAYTIRFTPRRPTSIWSAVNIRRMKELIAEGLVQPAGLAAWERRTDERSAIYRYAEAKVAKLPPAMLKRLKASARAWAFYSAQAPSYQRIGAWYVISAKKEETREKRFTTLLRESAAGRRLGPQRAIRPRQPSK